MTMFYSSLANLGLRSLALGSKFLFLVYAGKYLAVEEMATYGLMGATVSIAVTLLGLEFYAFSTREILARDNASRAVCLRDQLAFHGIAYLALLPLSLPVFATGILPWSLAGWFVVLSILDHLGQETARILNTIFRPVLSTALFFLRSAAWGIVVVVLWLWQPDVVSLAIIFGAWSAGTGFSLLIAAAEFRRLGWHRSRHVPINWGWIGHGIVVAGPFLISALSYRAIELADRYIIHFLVDNTAVGVYSFYGTLANVIPAIVGAAVSSILVPRIIRAYQTGNAADYHSQYRRLTVMTVGIVVASIPAVFLAIAALQPYLGKQEYVRELPTCAVLLLSTAVSIVAQIPGVALYARKDDIALLIAVLIGAGTNIPLNFLLIPQFGIVGAAWATALSYASMGAYQLYRVTRQPTKVGVSQGTART
jgi:O-antigen/teichoic acid export membrane protein